VLLGHGAAGAAAAAGAARGLRGLPENEGNNRTRLSSGCHPDSTLLVLCGCCTRWLVPEGKRQPALGASAQFPVDRMIYEQL